MKYLSKILLLLVCGIIILLALVFKSEFVIEKYTPHEAAPEQAKFITLADGEEVAYQEISHNAPTTIIFIGGLSGWSGTWERTMKELNSSLAAAKKPYNLIAIDLPPFGYSTADLKKGFHRKVQADRVNEFVKIQKLSNVILVAHSYGAGPATEAVMVSTSTPNIVEKLVIINGVLNIGEDKVIEKSFVHNTRLLETFVEIFSHSTFVVKNRLQSFVYKKDYINKELAHLYMQPFNVEGNSKRLAFWLRDYMTDSLKDKSTISVSYEKLVLPVRIIWGDKDTLTPPELADELSQLLPNDKKYILTDVGHIPMIEDYQQFDAALLRAVLE